LPNTPRGGQPGLLEECDGGTLFLDDFDRLPLNAQDLLLYPLEGKAFLPGIGSGPPRQVSVKFVLATNQNPEELVERGNIPPLRDRLEDIPLLVDHLVGLVGREFNHYIESVSPKAMNLIRNNQYRRGNVRELYAELNVRELYAELRTAIGKASLENDPVLRAGYLSNGLQEVRVGANLVGEKERLPQIPDRVVTPMGDPKTDTPTTSQDIPVELAVLRQHAFEIRESEKALGLSHKSKTLSTASDERRVIARVRRKMERYVRSIREKVADRTEERLYNNLPSAYHKALSEAIRRIAVA
jgi:DNA-binding NtrC family response regulator